MNRVEQKANLTDKLKVVFKRLYGESMDIWEETLFEALPCELTEFISHSVDAAEKICDLIDIYRQRMSPDITQSDIKDLTDWLNIQGTKYSARLMAMLHYVNINLAAIAQMKQDLLP